MDVPENAADAVDHVAHVDHRDSGDSHVLDELAAREPLFRRPEFGTTRSDFAAMTAEDFWEVGASGRRYDREFVLDVLDERAGSRTPMSGRPATS